MKSIAKKIVLQLMTAATALMIAAPLTSCNDMLTQSSPNVTLVENYWANLNDTRAGVYAMYAGLRNRYLVNVRNEAWRSDLTWPGFGRPTPQNNQVGWMWYTHGYTNSTTEVIEKWEAIYIVVWRANQLIEALERLQGGDDINESIWQQQMGHAKFIRGLMYFYLHSSYNGGSVVLHDRCVTDIDGFNKPLAPAEEVLAFFRADLEEAYELLLPRSQTTGSYETLATKGSAATILGTSYLYEGDYTSAKKWFEEVINSGEYKLETDYAKIHTTAGEHNAESILEVNYSSEDRTDMGTWDPNSMATALNTLMTTNAGAFPAAWLAALYLEEAGDPTDERNTDVRLTRYLYGANQNKFTTGDDKKHVSWRTTATVAVITDESTPYYITTNVPNGCQIGQSVESSWGFGKFKLHTNHDIMTAEVQSISGKNIVLNRYSDVLLMYAECLLQGEGDINGAVEYINMVRERWALKQLNAADYTKESLMEHIMHVERPLELSVEGHMIRWQDLRRWGLLENDENNVFAMRSKEVYYSYKYWYGGLNVDVENSTIQGSCKQNSYVFNEETAKLVYGEGLATYTAPVIDYEFTVSAKDYRRERCLYYPIPSTELMNNSAITNYNNAW